MAQRGLLGPELLAIHLTEATPDEAAMIANAGARMAVCNGSIGIIDGIVCPAVRLSLSCAVPVLNPIVIGISFNVCVYVCGNSRWPLPPPLVALSQEEFQAAGGKVALGSDQSPGNNCHNIWNEMKLTSLFNKIKNRDPTAMPCWKSLRMATVEGAEAIGTAHYIPLPLRLTACIGLTLLVV